MIGFTYFDDTSVPQPTTAELVAALDPAQRLAVLNGFAAKTPPIELKHQEGIATSIIRHLYAAIDAIEEFSRTTCRSDTPPSTVTGLRALVAAGFSDEFTVTQANAITNKMLAMSKSDGTGDFSYYIVEVKK